MHIAKDGRAIINGMVVPAGEVLLLHTLALQSGRVIGPQLRRLHEDALKLDEHERVARTPLSDASVYTYLNRLLERGLVQRETGTVPLLGKNRQFVFWKATEDVKKFFHEHDTKKD